ncbi:hypothetical protein Ddc_07815 [Ditylenchus destructor]|nr:hypothetical protein Ddc_07815 [Ditylenchus destructor]
MPFLKQRPKCLTEAANVGANFVVIFTTECRPITQNPPLNGFVVKISHPSLPVAHCGGKNSKGFLRYHQIHPSILHQSNKLEEKEERITATMPQQAYPP